MRIIYYTIFRNINKNKVIQLKIKTINGKYNIIGENLRKYRKLRNLTQRELSERLELLGLTIYHTDIHNIEHGKKSVRDYEVKGFCLALNINFENLFENTDKEYEWYNFLLFFHSL